MLGKKRRWKRPTNRDEGAQPVVGEERAIRAPHHATPASPFCCLGRVYLEHHQKQHFEHNQHLEGLGAMKHATPFLKAGIERITELCRMFQADQEFKISLCAAKSDFLWNFAAILHYDFMENHPNFF